MRASDVLLTFGLVVLTLLVVLIDAFATYRVPSDVQIGWFTILAEGLGFIGLSLVEITVFLQEERLNVKGSLAWKLGMWTHMQVP